MKNIKKITAIMLCGTMLAACNILDKDDPSAISDQSVWGDISYITAVFDNLYGGNLVPSWDDRICLMTDEGSEGSFGLQAGEYLYSVGSVDENTIPQANNISFSDCYAGIRRVNELLSHLDGSTLDPVAVSKLKGQALTFRAWVYFRLVRAYGGVPMIMNVQEPNDNLFVKRDKAATCVELIQKDLDDAIALADFPMKWEGNDAGRLSKAGALALKGRLLLMWASPQFNPGNEASRWTAAYDANKAARDACNAAGYGLYPDFNSMFFEANEKNSEGIWVTRYRYQGGREHGWMRSTYPSAGLGMAQRNNPTWEMVEAFPMKDGKPATAANGLDPVKYWENRDPRLNATIAYNGSNYPLGAARYASAGADRVQFTEPTLFDGADVAQLSPTYLYLRKAMDPTVTGEELVGHNGTDWMEIRYAELLMNLAECAIEVGGKETEAAALISEIRARAGIEAGADNRYGIPATMSKDQWIEFIMAERQVEFAFEAKREWDLLRRNMLQTLNGQKRHGRKPTLKTDVDVDALKAMKSADILANYDQYFTDEVIDMDTPAPMNYPTKYKFWPIRTVDLEKNSNLEQTAGWTGGTFDPLK